MIITNTQKKNPIVVLFIFTTLLSFFTPASFAQTPPVLVYSPVISSGFSSPLDIVNANGGTGRLFIAERTGKIRIVSGGNLLAGSFLDIGSLLAAGSENGLLSIAFHPNYASNGYFFTYYTDVNDNISITRFRSPSPLSNTQVNINTGVVIMTIPPLTTSYHNGGKMNFGHDGHLYFALGDGSPGQDPDNHAQNGNLLWGKMVRINVDNFNTPPYYTIPSDNPYTSNPNVRDEVFAIGLRNPWRWSFDRLNHDMWIADVGEAAWEEINSVSYATATGGLNYGWRCYEGNAPYNTSGCLPQNSYQSPIFTYDHSSAGGHSVTGGHVYRGSEYAAMYGWYICTDFISARTWMIKSNGSGGWVVGIQNSTPSQIVGFGEDQNGVLYAVSLSGTLYKVSTNSIVLPVTMKAFSAKAYNGYNELKWKTTNEQNLSLYDIEFSYDGTNYTSAGKINALNSSSENNYSYQHFITGFTKLFYRIKIVNKDGSITYSDVVRLDNSEKSYTRIYPTLLTDNRLNIVTQKPVEQLTLFSADGKPVYQSRLNNLSGTINVSLPDLQTGFYIVQLKMKDEYFNEKIMIRR